MYGDYGYEEEGKLGKPYNLRLMKRLARYGLPYKKTIGLALSFTILITLFDLVVPYLSKIAIDRYILAAWYRVDMGGKKDLTIKDLISRYGHLLEKDREGSYYYISNLDMKELDPAHLHTYKAGAILATERLYRVRAELLSGTSLEKGISTFIEMRDGSLLIPYKVLNTLPKKELLKIRGKDVRGVAMMALIFLVLVVFSFGLGYGEHYLFELTGQNVMQNIRVSLFERIQSQAMRFFDRHPVGRLVTRVTNDVENLNEMIKSFFITVFKDFFLLTGILILLLCLNWRLAMACFILIPFIFGLTFLFSKMAREAFRELRSTVAKINAFLQERITAMRVIQLFVRERFQMASFERINQQNYLAGMKQIRVFAIFMPIMELFSSLTVALLIWHGGGKVIGEQLTLGSLVAFIGYIQMFFKPIRDISEKYNIMQLAMASTERIFEFMDHNEEMPEPEHPFAPSQVKGHLQFKEVSFAYEQGQPVLHSVSFDVRPGETVAIVGPTGSGKTTVINLVKRFYDPDNGLVLLDGVDLREWSLRELQSNIGLCMQDVFVFSGSLAENISLGDEGLDIRDLDSAARIANALSFIQRLPAGFQHELGEGGATLSAGERQLLSFARALAHGPRILILDEATSSVDPETERLIQEAISRMALERTTLVIAHRLSTIRNADRILVMHHGRVVEEGTHEQLIALGKVYHKLSKLRETHKTFAPNRQNR
jgi:ATP-binding cassette subfamily B multidrug efflux pump